MQRTDVSSKLPLNTRIINQLPFVHVSWDTLTQQLQQYIDELNLLRSKNEMHVENVFHKIDSVIKIAAKQNMVNSYETNQALLAHFLKNRTAKLAPLDLLRILQSFKEHNKFRWFDDDNFDTSPVVYFIEFIARKNLLSPKYDTIRQKLNKTLRSIDVRLTLGARHRILARFVRVHAYHVMNKQQFAKVIHEMAEVLSLEKSHHANDVFKIIRANALPRFKAESYLAHYVTYLVSKLSEPQIIEIFLQNYFLYSATNYIDPQELLKYFCQALSFNTNFAHHLILLEQVLKSNFEASHYLSAISEVILDKNFALRPQAVIDNTFAMMDYLIEIKKANPFQFTSKFSGFNNLVKCFLSRPPAKINKATVELILKCFAIAKDQKTLNLQELVKFILQSENSKQILFLDMLFSDNPGILQTAFLKQVNHSDNIIEYKSSVEAFNKLLTERSAIASASAIPYIKLAEKLVASNFYDKFTDAKVRNFILTQLENPHFIKAYSSKGINPWRYHLLLLMDGKQNVEKIFTSEVFQELAKVNDTFLEYPSRSFLYNLLDSYFTKIDRSNEAPIDLPKNLNLIGLISNPEHDRISESIITGLKNILEHNEADILTLLKKMSLNMLATSRRYSSKAWIKKVFTENLPSLKQLLSDLDEATKLDLLCKLTRSLCFKEVGILLSMENVIGEIICSFNSVSFPPKQFTFIDALTQTLKISRHQLEYFYHETNFFSDNAIVIPLLDDFLRDVNGPHIITPNNPNDVATKLILTALRSKIVLDFHKQFDDFVEVGHSICQYHSRHWAHESFSKDFLDTVLTIFSKQAQFFTLTEINNLLGMLIINIPNTFPILEQITESLDAKHGEPSFELWSKQIKQIHQNIFTHKISGIPLDEAQRQFEQECKPNFNNYLSTKNLTASSPIDYFFKVSKNCEAYVEYMTNIKPDDPLEKETLLDRCVHNFETIKIGNYNEFQDTRYFGSLDIVGKATLGKVLYHVQRVSVMGVIYSFMQKFDANEACRLLANIGPSQGKTMIIGSYIAPTLIKLTGADFCPITTLTDTLAEVGLAHNKPMLDRLGISNSTNVKKGTVIWYTTAQNLAVFISQEDKQRVYQENPKITVKLVCIPDEGDILFNEYKDESFYYSNFAAEDVINYLIDLYHDSKTSFYSYIMTPTSSNFIVQHDKKIREEAARVYREPVKQFVDSGETSFEEGTGIVRHQTLYGIATTFFRKYKFYLSQRGGNVKEAIEKLKEEGFHIPNNKISYNNVLKDFSHVIAVSGTFGSDDLINRYHAMGLQAAITPLFTNRKLVDLGATYCEEKDWFPKILEEMKSYNEKRPIYIVFKYPETALAFKTFYRHQGFTSMNCLVGNESLTEYQNFLLKATGYEGRSSVSLIGARSVDTTIYNGQINQLGGMAVIDAAVQKYARIQDQIQNRTARLGYPGSYKAIWSKKDVIQLLREGDVKEYDLSHENLLEKVACARKNIMQAECKQAEEKANADVVSKICRDFYRNVMMDPSLRPQHKLSLNNGFVLRLSMWHQAEAHKTKDNKEIMQEYADMIKPYEIKPSI